MVKKKKNKKKQNGVVRRRTQQIFFFLFLAFYLFIYFSRDIDPLCFRRLRPIRDAEDAGRGFSFFFFSFLLFSFFLLDFCIVFFFVYFGDPDFYPWPFEKEQ